jgi:glucose/arabinose dehydrogenase
LFLDPQGRLYIVANQRNETVVPRRNDVTIFRAQTQPAKRTLDKPQAWFQTSYPWGIGGFNHGVSNIRLGPDGKIYVTSGSRTDGGEPGEDPLFSQEGETPITAAIWRLDPKLDKPQLEVFARGLRNAFGFAWNERGELFSVDHGPDADAPEELNLVQRGHHYGFPYEFSNWTQSPYNFREAPPGLKFTLPVPNIGPLEGSPQYPLSTFKPHAAPTGMTYLGADFPAQHRGGFLIARYGIQLGDRWASRNTPALMSSSCAPAKTNKALMWRAPGLF